MIVEIQGIIVDFLLRLLRQRRDILLVIRLFGKRRSSTSYS